MFVGLNDDSCFRKTIRKRISNHGIAKEIRVLEETGMIILWNFQLIAFEDSLDLCLPTVSLTLTKSLVSKFRNVMQ